MDKVSNLLWAIAFVMYTWVVAVRVRLTANDCDCERLVSAYSLQAEMNMSIVREEEGVNEACYDPIRWALWTDNTTIMKTVRSFVTPAAQPVPKFETKNTTRKGTNATIINQSHALLNPKKRPFRPKNQLRKNLKFYGFAANTEEDPPDRDAYLSFFIDDHITTNTTGTFVEAGAGDGRKHSNTLFFEESLGWGGLLIEGDMDSGKKLLSNRTRRAPNTKRILSTICEPKFENQEVRYVGVGDEAGVELYMSKEHVQRHESSWGQGWRQKARKVKCTTLRTLLEQAGIGSVDLMTINLSGAEKAAIEGLDEKIVQVRVLVVSMEDKLGEAEHDTRKLLMEKGFCYAHRLGRNEYWVADEVMKREHCAWAGLREEP